MSGRLRWIVALVLVLPISATLLALHLMLVSTLWGLANLAWGVGQQSPSAISRGLTGVSATLTVAGRTTSAWAAVVPGDSGVSTVGAGLSAAGGAAAAAAPQVPTLLGFEGTSRYLVAALNDAELFGSGGAPLDLAVVEVDRARARMVASGSVGNFNPNNQPYAWPVTGGLPWYREGAKYPFANSNYHPDFPISGKNMTSAWNALGQPQVTGVITADVSAVAAMLGVIGPVQTEGYGEVSADTVIRLVLVDAYREHPIELPGEMEQRQRNNSELRAALVDELSNPLTAVRAVAALWGTFPARHVQAYFADPGLQSICVAAGAQAALATQPGDVLGVFTQSGVSKLAVFQRRTITREVDIATDGSASVVQTVRFANDVPPGLAGDPTTHSGYLALIFRQRVAFRIPESATDAAIEVTGARALVGAESTGPFPDDVGAQVLWQGQDIPPREASSTTVAYRLPPGTFGTDGRLAYQLVANPQAMVKPVELQVTVTFPQAPKGARGWKVSDNTATWSGTLDQTLHLNLEGP